MNVIKQHWKSNDRILKKELVKELKRYEEKLNETLDDIGRYQKMVPIQ